MAMIWAPPGALMVVYATSAPPIAKLARAVVIVQRRCRRDTRGSAATSKLPSGESTIAVNEPVISVPRAQLRIVSVESGAPA